MPSPIDLLSLDALPPGSEVVYVSPVAWYPGRQHRIIVLDTHWVLHLTDDAGVTVDQFEFPKGAGAWLAETVEKRFWTPVSAGGLPNTVRQVEGEISGETLSVARTVNAGAEAVPGFVVGNESRPSHRNELFTQREVIPDFVFRETTLYTVLRTL